MHGQALIELPIVFAITALVTIAGGRFLWRSWTQFYCAYEVFEATQASLLHIKQKKSNLPIRIYKTDRYMEGVGRCPMATETVQLPHLDAARW